MNTSSFFTRSLWRASTAAAAAFLLIHGTAFAAVSAGADESSLSRVAESLTRALRIACEASGACAEKVRPPNPQSAPMPAAQPQTEALGDCCELPLQRARALALVNRIRAQGAVCGPNVFGPAASLKWSEQLNDASYVHAADMAHRQYFEHRSPDGQGPADRVTQQGYAWRAVAENIAAGQQSLDEVVDAWLRSPGHCRNLMNPQLTELGLAGLRVQAGPYGTYWVMTLGTPSGVRSGAATHKAQWVAASGLQP